MNKAQAAKDILKNQDITSWFQPIINIETQEVLGWEAFTRAPSVSPFKDLPALFDSAAEAGVLKPLDLMCMHNAAQCFEQLQLQNKLFVNLSSEMILASGKLKDQIIDLINISSVPATQMVLEIDARNASTHVQNLFSAAHFFHEQGFEIAINDVGASGSSQYLWAELKPDYVKVDRYFVSGINGDQAKQEQVKDIVAAARSLGARIIAKGVETQAELSTLHKLGVNIVQGYLIQKPELSPLPPDLSQVAEESDGVVNSGLACDLAVFHDKVDATAPVSEVYDCFEENISLGSVAVLDDEKPVGMVYRNAFMAKLSSPQRRKVLLEKPISTEMDKGFLDVDSHLHFEQVVRMVTARARLFADQDFTVSNHGKFLGIGTVVDLLRKVSEMKVKKTEGLNVLSMLPGNAPIAERVNELLENNAEFTIALLDLTNFKPYNNAYGHIKGDELLVMFSELLRKHVSGSDFAGHVGGDEFIIVCRKSSWQQLFCSVCNEFTQRVKGFYSKEDQQRGFIEVYDLAGELSEIGFVSVTGSVLSVKDEYYDSFQALLKKLIQIKQMARGDEHVAIAHLNEIDLDYLSYDGNELKVISSDKV